MRDCLWPVAILRAAHCATEDAGLVGSAAGCAINHHCDTVKDRNAAAAAQPTPAATTGSTTAPAATTTRQ